MLVVSTILLMVNYFTGKLFTIEILAALAVVLSFGHMQISSRLAEQEHSKATPSIRCYRRLSYYLVGKEVLWFIYFLTNKSYSALVGVVIFLLYPFWRKWWKS